MREREKRGTPQKCISLVFIYFDVVSLSFSSAMVLGRDFSIPWNVVRRTLWKRSWLLCYLIFTLYVCLALRLHSVLGDAGLPHPLITIQGCFLSLSLEGEAGVCSLLDSQREWAWRCHWPVCMPCLWPRVGNDDDDGGTTRASGTRQLQPTLGLLLQCPITLLSEVHDPRLND